MSMGSLGSGDGGATRSFGERLFGALKLDATVYEEVEHDTSAMGQAAAVVLLASIAQGAGAFQEAGTSGALASVIGSFLGWAIGAGIVWVIGVKIMNCTSDYGELLRTLGFATAPGILAALGVLPLGDAAWILGLAIFVLSVIAAVIAVRQALDVSTGRAVVVCIIANLVPLALVLGIGLVLLGIGIGTGAPPAPGAMGF